MIDKAVAKLVLEHTPRESGASFAYAAMALWANRQGMFQFEGWLWKNSREELDHRDKMLKYLNDFNCPVSLLDVRERKVGWADVGAVLTEIVAMETKVYEFIAEIVSKAAAVGDWNSFQFFQWFVDEQRDSVAYAMDLQARYTASNCINTEFDEWFED